MRSLYVVLLLICGLNSASVFANDSTDRSPCGAATSVGATAAASQSRYWWNNGAWWYRSADGAWYVWTPGFWTQSRSQNDKSPQARTAADDAGRVYSYKPTTPAGRQNPNVFVSYPDEDDDNTYFGVDWYRNGRGPFSD